MSLEHSLLLTIEHELIGNAVVASHTPNIRGKGREVCSVLSSHILFKMENNAPVILPAGFEQEIERISIRDLNSFSKEYHLDKRPDEGCQ